MGNAYITALPHFFLPLQLKFPPFLDGYSIFSYIAKLEIFTHPPLLYSQNRTPIADVVKKSIE